MHAFFTIHNRTKANPHARHLSPKDWLQFHRDLRDHLGRYGTCQMWLNPANILIQTVVIRTQFDDFVDEEEFESICASLHTLLDKVSLDAMAVTMSREPERSIAVVRA